MSSTGSLRDLYSPSQSAWSFVPPQSSSSSPSTSQSPPASAPSYRWSTRPTPNSIFELSPSLNPSGDPNSDGDYDFDLTAFFRTLVASAVLQYTSTAIVMPWEVAKLLLQVQWVPRDATAQLARMEQEAEEEEEQVPIDEETDDSSENENYFTDPTNGNATASPRPRRPVPRLADDQGYIVRRSVLEEGTRPEYVIPVGSADGVWDMMKRIGRFRGEGWLALWKGLLTHCITEVLSTTLQPLIHTVLQSISSSAAYHPPSTPLLLPVTSHIITGFILSPLDLVRTRLIVQSSIARHRTYTGPLSALSRILAEEGGFAGLYFHPHLLFPTLIDAALRPLIALALPRVLLGVEDPMAIAAAHPVAWLAAEFVGSCVGLLIALPFETVRRRLQVQVRGRARPLKTCVEVRPMPYNGVVDTLWRVLTEERSDLPVRRNRTKGGKGKGKTVEGQEEGAGEEGEENESWLRNTGLGQLYRGLGMRLGASAIIFVVGLLRGPEENDAGWAEL